jgi:signal peptidase II
MIAPTWRPALAATWISGALLIADQLSKALVLRSMRLHESIALLPSLNLTYTRNPGAAFSLFADTNGTFRFWFFTLVSIAAMALVITFLRRVAPGDWWSLTALSLILGGALGNVVDRVRFGEVIDFIDVYVGPYHWPVFNFADSGITIGMVMLLGHLVFHRDTDPRPAANS